jgi:adenosylhomocysteine nucleosidase
MQKNFLKSEKKIGIIGAMDYEIKEYLKNLSGKKEIAWKDFKFYTGRLLDKNVVVAKSGVGKVFAAMICQKLIDEFNVGAILFTGVAGALDKSLDILDVVVAKDCLYHDLDVSALGFKRGEIPYTKYRIFKSCKELKVLALGAKINGNKKIIEGRILTGDKFFSGAERAECGYLTEELGGTVIEMEGAAAAQVCTVNQIPFLVVRSVSDRADGLAVKNFNSFAGEAAKNSFKVISQVLSHL